MTALQENNNPEFKLVEFDQFKDEAGYNHFVLFPKCSSSVHES